MRGLGAKIFAATALVVVAVLGGALLVAKGPADRAAEESISRQLAATQSSIEDAIASRSRALAQQARLVAQVPDYRARVDEALRNNQRSDILDQADEFRRQVGASWALITDAAGVLQARTNNPDQFGDSLGGGSAVGIPLGGDVAEGFWSEARPDGAYDVYQAVGVPILSPGGSTVYAVLVAAIPVDSSFADSLKRHTNSHIVFFTLDTLNVPRVSVSTLPPDVAGSRLSELPLDSIYENQGDVQVHWRAGEETLVGIAGATRTAGGDPSGGYVGLRSRDLELAAYAKLSNTLKGAFVGGLILAIVSSLIVAGQVTKPAKQLVALTRQVAEGQYNTKIEIKTKDEIGDLAQAFRKMVAELKEKQALLEYMTGSAEQTVQLNAGQVAGATAVRGGGKQGTLKLVTDASGMLQSGSTLGNRYVIKEVLGVGGMGVVYRATDRELDETVAIKTLKMDTADATSLERFKQEIRLARRITHRNVVRTHDLGETEGMYYITMEYVEGANLKKVIQKRGRLPVSVTLTVGKQLLRALEVAHEQGVIHRDIKPQNLVVDPGGFLKVMDFGIARLAEGRQKEGSKGEGLTAVGVAIGTPEYMAPEQLLGEELDARADLYAAGTVLYECLTGHPVFNAPTVTALVVKHIEEEPADPRGENPEIPAQLAEIILKALAKSRDDRWRSAAEMLHALEEVRAEGETVAA